MRAISSGRAHLALPLSALLFAACSGAPAAPSRSTDDATGSPLAATAGGLAPARRVAAGHANVIGVVSATDEVERTLTVTTRTSAAMLVTVPELATIQTGDAVPVEFADIIAGTSVHVLGQAAGGVFTAETVEVRATVVSGKVAALSGSCPDIAFSIGDRGVVGVLDTEFARGACPDVADGMTVEVRGTIMGGVVTAQRIALPHEHGGPPAGPDPTPEPPSAPKPKEVHFDGTVTAVEEACPAAALTIGGRVIRATTETHYPAASCDAIAVGVQIAGRGVEEGDEITASQNRVAKAAVVPPAPDEPPPPPSVTPAPPPPPAPPAAKDARIAGVAASVAGSCPSLTFQIGSYTVETGPATNFVGSGRCELIVAGKSVEVTGAELDGVVRAVRVKVQK